MNPPAFIPPVRPRPDLRALEGYHSPQVSVKVRLNTNESPYPPPQEWVDALADAARGLEYHRYPDREARALRRAIGELHGVEANWVFVANGSNEVLQTLLLAYAGPGSTVVTFEPTYAMHGQIARTVGARVAEGERGPDFALEANEVRRVLARERPEVTFLCSPNNPTGVVDSPTLVEEALSGPCGLLVVDEAYGQFSPWSALVLVSMHRPLVVTRTYSKTWSMAATRLGYCIAPPWVVDELHKVVLPYHLDALKQAAGLLALSFRSEMEARVQLLVQERERLSAALATLGVDVWPSGANFVLFRVRPPGDGQGPDANAVWQGLVDRSVLVRNCVSWPRLRGCLRVTVGAPEENDAFLGALACVLAGPAGAPEREPHGPGEPGGGEAR